MNERINIKVGPEFGELHAHLSRYGDSKGERFKVLASIGSIVEDSGIDFRVVGNLNHEEGCSDWNGRVTVRLSSAYHELRSKILEADQSKAGRLKLLANLGLLAMRGNVMSARACEAQLAQPVKKDNGSTFDITRLDLAEGMFGESDTDWR
tara:strand:- start:333 stop:785 length:453 start_codon:yes stop_codon:yes gene_type:complete